MEHLSCAVTVEKRRGGEEEKRRKGEKEKRGFAQKL
jgi:hypothetical protein